MNKDRDYDLLITIVNRGNADLVIEAAKKDAKGASLAQNRKGESAILQEGKNDGKTRN